MSAVQPFRCPVVLRGPDGVEWSFTPPVGNDPAEPSTTVEGGNEPWPALVNRADRRRAVRAQRKRGRS